MVKFLAIANRKGGVGKSTITTMLAHSLAVWEKKRVLVLDLDSQANTSLILFGGTNWYNARKANKTISDYLSDNYAVTDSFIDTNKYIHNNVSDLVLKNGNFPPISLVPGSLILEDQERGELITLTNQNFNLLEAEVIVIRRIAQLIRALEADFDVILMDCPPGLSLSTRAALAIAEKVIVPFKPDFVSTFAVDRIADMIGWKNKDDTFTPFEKRKYWALVNFLVKEKGTDEVRDAHNIIIQEVGAYHPLLNTRIEQSIEIARAFDWNESERSSIEQKYGDGLVYIDNLCKEVLSIVNNNQ